MKTLFHARLRHSSGLFPRHRPAADRLLVHPKRVGKVGAVYYKPSTGLHRARVYWNINGQWYAVNMPLGHLEPC
jgi:hypothetical protein